jgi:hypothetical protein
MAKAKARARKQGTREGDRSILTCRLTAGEGSGRFMTVSTQSSTPQSLSKLSTQKQNDNDSRNKNDSNVEDKNENKKRTLRYQTPNPWPRQTQIPGKHIKTHETGSTNNWRT